MENPEQLLEVLKTTQDSFDSGVDGVCVVEGCYSIEQALRYFAKLRKDLISQGAREMVIVEGPRFLSRQQHSEYELFPGTEFETPPEEVLEVNYMTDFIKRGEVYLAVHNLAKPELKDFIYYSLDRKFPRDVWEETLPRFNALAHLVNNHLDSFLV